MPNRSNFIGSQDNLFVPDAPTVGTATAGVSSVSVAFTAPSDVGGDAVTLYGASAFLAGATVNYKVSVATGTLSTGGSGNVFFIDGIPTKQLTLIKGFTYVFDQSDSSNSGHPFAFKDSGGSSYTTGVTTSGTAGNASATVTLVLATDASEPSSYYCTSHGNGMGNTISLIAPSASTDPLSTAEAGATGSSSPITLTGLTNGTSYIAQVWAINDYGNGPLSSASSSFTPSLSRALFVGMKTDASSDASRQINYITVTTTGDAADFGDTIGLAKFSASSGSDTRALFYEGYRSGGYANVISYATITSLGNATDFGNLSEEKGYSTSTSNNVRSMHFGGYSSGGAQNKIEYVTIPSTGNSIDFGDMSNATGYQGACGSSTRAVVGGGYISTYTNIIEHLTMASAGNATDFGDLTVARTCGALSSSTRGVWGGGSTGSNSDVMDYVTIASAGNASDFGNLTVARGSDPDGAATSTRGVFAGGQNQNIIDYIAIASTGNATDFGDLIGVSSQKTGGHCSDDASVQNESYFAPAAMGLIAHGRLVGGAGNTAVSYIDIATTGRLAMFGDLSGPSSYVISGGAASTTRGVFAGIHTASGSLGDDLEFFTFSTKGKSTDFGDATQILYGSMGSNSTRGVLQVGYDGSTYTINTIEYITIASAGDTTDFGDLTEGGSRSAPAGSTTRLLFMGRDAYGTGTQNGSDTVDYVTIASTGDATDFGNLSTAIHYAAGVSSNTRAVKCGGWSNSNTTAVNEIDYFTITSTGNATDFGDLTVARGGMAGCSSKVRGVLGTGANASGGSTNVLDYITIASTGNAVDWGDWYASHTSNRSAVGGVSNSHGGLA